MSSRFARVFTAVAVISLTVVGCASEQELEPAPTPPSGVAQPEETATPTPTPTPFVPDCNNIISDQAEETLQAEGFVLVEEHESKIRVEQRVETLFFDNGGVDCLWGIAGGGDSLVVFGYSEITPAQATEAQAQLEAEGYLRSEEAGDTMLSIDPEHDVMGIGDVFVFSADEWFHSTTLQAVSEIRAQVSSQKP